jgi:hypothetical protein
MECVPAFNYARTKHTTLLLPDDSIPSVFQNKVLFTTPQLILDLRYVPESTMDNVPVPTIDLQLSDQTQSKGLLGLGASCELNLAEGQAVTFVLRTPPDYSPPTEIKLSEQKAEELGVPLDSK